MSELSETQIECLKASLHNVDIEKVIRNVNRFISSGLIGANNDIDQIRKMTTYATSR